MAAASYLKPFVVAAAFVVAGGGMYWASRFLPDVGLDSPTGASSRPQANISAAAPPSAASKREQGAATAASSKPEDLVAALRGAGATDIYPVLNGFVAVIPGSAMPLAFISVENEGDHPVPTMLRVAPHAVSPWTPADKPYNLPTTEGHPGYYDIYCVHGERGSVVATNDPRVSAVAAPDYSALVSLQGPDGPRAISGAVAARLLEPFDRVRRANSGDAELVRLVDELKSGASAASCLSAPPTALVLPWGLARGARVEDVQDLSLPGVKWKESTGADGSRALQSTDAGAGTEVTVSFSPTGRLAHITNTLYAPLSALAKVTATKVDERTTQFGQPSHAYVQLRGGLPIGTFSWTWPNGDAMQLSTGCKSPTACVVTQDTVFATDAPGS
ncbi:hypothetical protein F6X40_10220 [Paraburkholderia sp. UCT31]|uniref:hypothetical protein n=1 Tax=Paraburkholderia sp. UCT31 TaxID=2615209 RepID=UPI0016553E3A|nr:hypothetical protein [Paraburkholderia sp. UCT31]MBC8737183.1 hypothetical protein [Paraburkholderia sp. UCT31]